MNPINLINNIQMFCKTNEGKRETEIVNVKYERWMSLEIQHILLTSR